MFCGNCLRDNALVAALRTLGHQALMVPLYLPLTLDEKDESSGTPIFFGGINVYLEQKSALFRHSPEWLHRWLKSPRLLKWAANKAAQTRPAGVGDITLSMLRGEEGKQACELDEIIAFLKTQAPPDVICLSNALLAGMVRKLKEAIPARVVCTLQGEHAFLDGLPEPYRSQCWQELADRLREADSCIAPSRFFADLMSARLRLSNDRVKVVFNGINLEGYEPAPASPSAPAIGFFARICPEKGLEVLVDAYILLQRQPRWRDLRLRVGGSCLGPDLEFLEKLKQKLRSADCLENVEFHPNVSRKEKIELLRSLTVFSVPATYGEAFGLYVIEALAAGVPVVLPRSGAFPELVQATGGGLLCEAGQAASLAEGIESLLANPARARSLGQAGQRIVWQDFTSARMAETTVRTLEQLAGSGRQSSPPAPTAKVAGSAA
jgi:glycosyltransferase involved in cell wall biosynthesis